MRTDRWNLLPCKHGLGRISQFQGGLVSAQWKQDKESMNMGRTWASLVKKRKICMGLFPFLSPPNSEIFLSSLMSLLCFKGRATQQDKKTEGRAGLRTGKQNITLAALLSWSARLQVQVNRFLFLVLLPDATSVCYPVFDQPGVFVLSVLVSRLRKIHFKEKRPCRVTYFERFVPAALAESP